MSYYYFSLWTGLKTLSVASDLHVVIVVACKEVDQADG